ncbi:fungal hydrophobin [Coprinopsis marcescibilis]|uniref:Hydrophobin n=1 Tax=Coprinopsis marcescibilis TaxID=230819 RepID=A0A5C3LCZ1_COPMA|nr:fungal hydrophobin [Coprinopsis marcescibilis]
MYFNALLIALPSLAAFALAAPALEARQTCGHNIMCCQSVQAAGTEPTRTLLALLGITVIPDTTLVGVNCSRVSVIGIGGSQCTSQLVCCAQIFFGGLVAVECHPISFGI